MAQTTQENQIKCTTQLANLQESINFINEKFQKYEPNRREKEREIKERKENVSTVGKGLDDLYSVLDRQEPCVSPMPSIEEESNKNADQCGINVLGESMGETISI